MGEMIFEFILEVFFNGIISFIDFPGALFHWLFRKNSMPFKEITERYFGINLLISILFYGAITIIVL
ncbi:hypothetical protein HYN59_00430 [Flavobacterium album]|uniref:Uncharacterized protein n=1 Tax=Flavobacterium album TaxID=2175091 RepID=A0A2S1QTE5_9FLAO|nr:hypothetical protein HYN59_00430 [Flavobacterium album]